MTDTMLERLARAACGAKVKNAPDSVEKEAFIDEFWHAEMESVRAILTELREPTREMYLAPNWNKVRIERDIVAEDAGKTVKFGITGYEATDIWQAMIDAILNKDAKP